MKKALVLTVGLAVGFCTGVFFRDSTLPVTAAGTEKCAEKNGDVNADSKIDISDVIYLVKSLFTHGPDPVPFCTPECPEAPPVWVHWKLEDGGNGHWYRLTSGGCWNEAEAEAVREGGHLVAVNDSAEQAWLAAHFPPSENDPTFWIGLYQDLGDPECAPDCEPAGGWRWISGDPSTYRSWAGGEPNNDTRAVPSENFALTNCYAPGLWCDFNECLQGIKVRGIIEVSCGPAGLPSTGQTKCYDSGGTEIDCTSADFPGQDGFYKAGCPSEGRFVDNGNGTVTDNCTGLMWQQQTVSAETYPWDGALQYCENLDLAGYTDWRLPNVRELQSIVNYGRRGNSNEFILGGVPEWYWSSSSCVLNPGSIFIVWFSAGVVELNSCVSCSGYVRAVRRAP